MQLDLKMPSGTFRLSQASIEDCLYIARQFSSQTELTDWGGEGFIYPMKRQQFLQQLFKPQTRSYILSSNQTCGFGQICERFDKHHLARLLICAPFRQKRYSYVLVLCLIQKALKQQNRLDFSLFVFKHNQAAIQCYQKLGFEIAPQPMAEHPSLYFMVLRYQKAQQIIAALPSALQIKGSAEGILYQFAEPDIGNIKYGQLLLDKTL